MSISIVSPNSIVPVGTIITDSKVNPPTGYLRCDGSAISRTLYPELFSAIGTTFGIGNGSTTFNLPDLVGAVPRGAGTSVGYTQNVTVNLGAKTDDAGQGHRHLDGGHSHGIPQGQAGNFSGLAGGHNGNGISGMGTSSASASLGDPTITSFGTPRITNETRMKNVGVNFFIKFE